MMREEMTPQRVWQEFTRAQNFNNAIELYETVEQNEDFYIGNQWRGVNAPNLDHPVMNMLCRVVKFFISSVMSDDIGISVTDFDESSAMKPVLDMLGVQFDQIMEGCGFKRKAREVIRNSAVDGDGCMHFYFDPEDDMQGAAGTAEAFRLTPTPGHIEAEIIENTNVHFGNPQSGDVQRQPYILLNFRRLVEEVRRTARENGGDADAIQPDEDTYKHGDAPEEGKVTVVRRYWKEKGRNGRKTVWFCEMTAGAVVRGPTDTGYSRYPIAFMPWEKVKNQYHGQAAITGMIPNQIFVNKLFAMAMQHVKQLAFPKVIYNRNLMAGRKWNNRVDRIHAGHHGRIRRGAGQCDAGQHVRHYRRAESDKHAAGAAATGLLLFCGGQRAHLDGHDGAELRRADGTDEGARGGGGRRACAAGQHGRRDAAAGSGRRARYGRGNASAGGAGDCKRHSGFAQQNGGRFKPGKGRCL